MAMHMHANILRHAAGAWNQDRASPVGVMCFIGSLKIHLANLFAQLDRTTAAVDWPWKESSIFKMNIQFMMQAVRCGVLSRVNGISWRTAPCWPGNKYFSDVMPATTIQRTHPSQYLKLIRRFHLSTSNHSVSTCVEFEASHRNTATRIDIYFPIHFSLRWAKPACHATPEREHTSSLDFCPRVHLPRRKLQRSFSEQRKTHHR